MRNLIASIADKIGWVTWYHVVYQWPTPTGLSIADTCLSVRPWLRQGKGIDQLREYLKERVPGLGATPNIISITRIGA